MADLSYKKLLFIKVKFPVPSLPHCMPISSLHFTLSPMPNNNLIPKKQLIMGCKKLCLKVPKGQAKVPQFFLSLQLKVRLSLSHGSSHSL